jgi:hypothetical protein
LYKTRSAHTTTTPRTAYCFGVRKTMPFIVAQCFVLRCEHYVGRFAGGSAVFDGIRANEGVSAAAPGK